MGIILKRSRQMFNELIGTNSFDEIFKNSIRDYYIYGFKSFEQFAKGRQRINEQWEVFSRILGAKWYLEKRKNGRNQITLKTEAVGSENPVDDLYFLHNLKQGGDYLAYLLDLDPRSDVRGGAGQLPVDCDTLESLEGKNGKRKLEDVNELEYAIIQNWLNEIGQKGPGKGAAGAGEDQDICMPVRINRQLNIWSPSTRYGSGYRTVINRTGDLYAYGILENLKDDPKRRNRWLQKEWAAYSPSGKRYLRETSGNNYWFKSDLTMEKLAEACGADTHSRYRFLCELKSMCRFFSQYYPLGEIGTILASRCGNEVEEKEVFRFKHNYLQRTLYDYNFIDLLTAIEKNCLCLVRYSHAVSSVSFEELMIPLEIRISVVNGREYVMYYHLTEQKIKALRLEFIDEITVYSSVKSIQKVKPAEKKAGQEGYTEEQILEELDVKFLASSVDKQIRTAKQMLRYIWGTEVSACVVSDSWRDQLITYEFDIACTEQESYILSRLDRENRAGFENHTLSIFPTKELRTWIRSFYVRVRQVSRMDTEDFHIDDDVEAMWGTYYGGRYFQDRDLEASGRREITDSGKADRKAECAEFVYKIEGNRVPETEGHGALFHELFSRYMIILANAVLKCAADSRKNIEEALREEAVKSLDYYNTKEIESVVRELKAYARDSGLIDQNGQTIFVMPPCDYLFHLLPLTKVEVRWLLTILEDPLAGIFLTEEWRRGLKEILSRAPRTDGAFQIQKICYFDRYQGKGNLESEGKRISPSGRITKKERIFLKLIYEAMKSEKKIRVSFRNWKGEKRSVICAPAWVEYSRRDDIFRIWYVQHKTEKIMKINLPRITALTVLDGSRYHLDREKKLLEERYQDTMTKIKVEFYQGKRNLPDRILTEFSLWKKKCIYDPQTEKYTMTLYYSTEDEKEILVRLLGYGPYIKILASEDNYVLEEIKRRIAVQRDLTQTQKMEHVLTLS